MLATTRSMGKELIMENPAPPEYLEYERIEFIKKYVFQMIDIMSPKEAIEEAKELWALIISK